MARASTVYEPPTDRYSKAKRPSAWVVVRQRPPSEVLVSVTTASPMPPESALRTIPYPIEPHVDGPISEQHSDVLAASPLTRQR
jgi:hypothetical protein